MSQNYQEISPINFDGFSPQAPAEFDISSIQLPTPNMSCYVEPIVSRGEVKYLRVEEPCERKTIVQNFNTSKTVFKDNVIHHHHIKNQVINVNRNHWHTQRVIHKENNYHHYLINNLIKVADIHHQKIEQVKGEGITQKDFKQTCRVEPASCLLEGQAEPETKYTVQNITNQYFECPEQKQGQLNTVSSY